MTASHRRTDGDETWDRLRCWVKGQKSAERLASHVLDSEEFKSIDPSHPLGGRDNIKDIICIKDNSKWVGACYFPRSQQTFSTVKKKFIADCKGIEKNQVDGIVFITNQELSLSERKQLIDCNIGYKTEIYHLERLVNILNSPNNYGVRLDFLDIEMTKEELLSCFVQRDKYFSRMISKIDRLEADNELFKDAMLEREFQLTERSEDEISLEIEELLDKIWYDRHQVRKQKIEAGIETVNKEIWEGALKSAKKVERKYGKKNLGPWDKFEWGMLNGKLSALRWVLGDDWDVLDT